MEKIKLNREKKIPGGRNREERIQKDKHFFVCRFKYIYTYIYLNFVYIYIYTQYINFA